MAVPVKFLSSAFSSLRRHPWRVLTAVVVLAAAAGGGAYAYYHHRQEREAEHLRAAEQALARYDFDEAQEHLAVCISLWPERGDVRLLAAQAARRAGRLPEAQAHLDECKRLEGETTEHMLEQRMLAVQKGDFRESEYLLKLLKDNPPQATLILEALAQGTYHVYFMGAAKGYAEKVLEREPGNVPMLLLLGVIWDSKTNFNEAEKDFRAALEAQPEHAQARLELARFLVRQRQFEEATKHFEILRERHFQRPAVLMGLAICRRQESRTPEERALLDELLAEYPNSADALAERGRLKLEAGELAEAERDLRAAVAQTPYDREAVFHLAHCLHLRGKDEESAAFTAKIKKFEDDMKSLGALTDEIGKKPNNAELHRQAGLICHRNGMDLQAERWLLGALQIDPRYKPTYQSLADFYSDVGRTELAAQYRAGAR
jgi:Tfp pilus assembly protein PilF